jgi:uncharacterized protein YuzE
VVWFDPEGDYLEVLFRDRVGYFTETADDRVMARVDMEGNVIGFSILGVGSIGSEPLSVELPSIGPTNGDA